MPITFTKPKAKTVAPAPVAKAAHPPVVKKGGMVAATGVSDFAHLIDEVGALQDEATPILQQIKELTAQLVPFKERLAVLQDYVDELPVDPDLKFHELGDEYLVEAGVKKVCREVKDLEAVRQAMGDEVFMQVAKVTLKDIDAYLTPVEKEPLLEVTRGSRSVKVVKRT